LVEALGEGGLRAGEDVAVRVERHPCVGVTEAFRGFGRAGTV
jgi:hypothetical protein